MSSTVDEFWFFLEKSWSDGLPVVTPTEERVQRMLKGTKRDAAEPVGEIPPSNGVRSSLRHGNVACSSGWTSRPDSR